MRNSNLTRRTLLKRSGAALLMAGMSATAGCTETLPPLGQQVQYGRVDVPDADTQPPSTSDPTYRQWFPAASALPTDDLNPRYVNFTTPSNLGADVIGFDNKDPHFFQKLYLDHFGIDYENYDQIIGMHSISTTYVLLGDIDPDHVGETLLDRGYSEASTHAGYNLYEREDSPRTAAVREGTIVWARHDQSSAIVKAVIDARNGDVQRQHEVDDAFALITDAIGTRPWIQVDGLGIDPTGEALLTSLAYTFSKGSLYYLHHTVYPEGNSPSTQNLKDALEKNQRGRDAWAVDIQVQDRLSTINMEMKPEQYQTTYTDVTVPQITWGITHEENEITIRHDGGDATPASDLTLYIVDGDDRKQLETQFADSVDTIEPGDSITIPAPASTTGRIAGVFSPEDVPRAAQFPIYSFQ